MFAFIQSSIKDFKWNRKCDRMFVVTGTFSRIVFQSYFEGTRVFGGHALGLQRRFRLRNYPAIWERSSLVFAVPAKQVHSPIFAWISIVNNLRSAVKIEGRSPSGWSSDARFLAQKSADYSRRSMGKEKTTQRDVPRMSLTFAFLSASVPEEPGRAPRKAVPRPTLLRLRQRFRPEGDRSRSDAENASGEGKKPKWKWIIIM